MTSRDTVTMEVQDAKVAHAFELQAAFKSPTLRKLSCAIIKASLRNEDYSIWPDDAALGELIESIRGSDKNCVGTAWRWLGKCGILSRGMERRGSTAGSSRGREIAQWHIDNVSLARTFLLRNDVKYVPDQTELFQ
jgi:hypothetical protein